MDRIIQNNQVYTYYEYSKEAEFERVVVAHSTAIFGNRSVYIDIKKKIGDAIVTIPDGYLIDFSFEADPRLYIIENELSSHDPYKHIGSQLLKFAISYKASGRKIKQFLLDHIMADSKKLKQVEEGLARAGHRNIDAFLDSIIFDKKVAAIVVIDQASSELENVLSQLTMETDIIEFQTYTFQDQLIHKFTPFNEEIRDLSEQPSSELSVEDLNTIVVPAREDGFNEVFLGEDSWYAIRISAAMLDRIKYIAAYQTAPISAITHYAEVASIDKHKETNKYIVYFREKAKKIGPIKLNSKKRGQAPQAPRYTSLNRLLKAKDLGDVF